MGWLESISDGDAAIEEENLFIEFKDRLSA